jgi:predicted component of viral defense system (DUF524 family)
MTASSLTMDVVGESGQRFAVLTVRAKGADARNGIPVLVDRFADDVRRVGAAGGLLEDSEYLYEVSMGGVTANAVRIEPREIFDPDDASGWRGRIRTRSFTGTVFCDVVAGANRGTVKLEVRSRKLRYRDEYRWMLHGIAAEGAELLMRRFAPAQLSAFEADPARDPITLYQRFAVLSTLLESTEVQAALARVTRQPDQRYVRIQESHRAGRGIKAGPAMIRQLTRSRGRGSARTLNGQQVQLPERLEAERFEATFDTEANQFVKYALSLWGTTCDEIERIFAGGRTPSEERATAEARYLRSLIERYATAPVLREVQRLRRMPAANQVLQKKPGYRELLAAYFTSEAGARFRWDALEDAYTAGQHDAARLYEYWAYLQLRQILETFCSEGMRREDLFELDSKGASLRLRRGRQRVLSGRALVDGRRIEIELWYNRTFRRPAEAWSRSMHPDCSIRLRATPGYEARPVETWLHFDAKYRIESYLEILGPPDPDSADNDQPNGTSAEPLTREGLRSLAHDLMKMHTYRDAIRRSSGAYVMYPGDDHAEQPLRQYEEVLPGVGAFALRPADDGSATRTGVAALERFLGDVMTHVANQASQRERANYWNDVAYGGPLAHSEANRALVRPPADTTVLIGYVRTPEQLDWIRARHLYNLRADTRSGSVAGRTDVLTCDFVLLYGPMLDASELWARSGPALILTASQMRERGYPTVRGDAYCCLPISTVVEVDAAPSQLEIESVRRAADPTAPAGAPVVVTWAALADQMAGRR